MRREPCPVKPTDLVVLTIGVIVASLRVPHLVSHQDHGHTQGHQGDCQIILHLAVAQLLHRRVIGRSFDAAVPAPVVIGAVAVVLAVRLVVFLIVGDEIVERETVVAGHEVEALLCLALLVAVDLGTADQPVGHAPQRPGFAAEEVAHIVPEAAVPLSPTISHKAADLIKPRSIPGFGNHLLSRQNWI